MRKKRSLFTRLCILSVWILVISFIVRMIYTHFFPAKKAISPLAVTKVSPAHAEETPLRQVVQNALSGTTGNYAVAIDNLTTGEQYELNQQVPYQSGSLYKLWVMATVYQQIQQGKLHDDDVLSEDIATLNQNFYIDPDNAELTDGTITLSVNDALTQMITISHNYAALLLTEKVKLSTVAAFLKTYGFTHSQVGTHGEDPVTTAGDIALFLQKLYDGQLGNTESTQHMLDLLKQQKLNEKLPLYLPDDIVVAHKTGELDMASHDAGIVYTPQGNYIIVVLTNTDNPDSANDRIATVSKDVYDYFMKGGETHKK